MTSADHFNAGLRPLRVVLDGVAIAVLVVGAGLAFGPAYGGGAFLLALGLGALVGGLAAVVPVLLRWPVWVSIPLAALGFLLLGGIAAAPRSSAGGMMPTLETVRLLAVGVIESWRQMLTVAVPVGSGGTLLLPAYLTALLLTLGGVLVALRTRRPLLTLLAPLVMAVGAALLGADEAYSPGAVGTAVVLLALLWAGWRSRASGRPGVDVRRPIGLIAVLVPAAVAGVLLGPGLLSEGQPRTTARSVVQPAFDPSALPSPLGGYRRYVKQLTNQTLFSVTGLPANVPVRLATLDRYTGQFFTTSADTGVFARVGDRVANPPAGTPADLLVTVGQYFDVWAPDAGFLTGVTFNADSASARLERDFRYNRDTGASLVTSGLHPGDGYQLSVSVPTAPTPERLAVAEVVPGLIDTTVIPAEVTAKAAQYTATVGAATPYAIVEAMRKGLHDNGWVSHGDDKNGVPGGHGIDRIRQLLTAKLMYGDAEQYAVALALMVQAQNIPARVVVGWAGQPEAKAGPVALTGGKLTAWVEVPFAGLGWVAFDPMPNETKPPPTSVPTDSPRAVDPQQQQPPPPQEQAKRVEGEAVQEPDTQDQDKDSEPNNDEKKQESAGWPWGWIALGGGLLILLLGPIVLVLLSKSRHRRTLAGGSPDQRIAGGWTYLIDRSADYRKQPIVGATRQQAARQLQESFGAEQSSVMVLAKQADDRVFAPEPVAAVESDEYWEAIERELAALSSTESVWSKLRARLSLASVRRAKRRNNS